MGVSFSRVDWIRLNQEANGVRVASFGSENRPCLEKISPIPSAQVSARPDLAQEIAAGQVEGGGDDESSDGLDRM
jgi:hypothetical protein